MKTAEIISRFGQYVIANYTRAPVVCERGEGVYVWDAEGKRYLDLFSGWAVCTLGHCHPRLVAALTEQLKRLLYMPNSYYWESQGRLAEILSVHSFGGQCFFCNSGAEAVEGAMKLARLYSGGKRWKIVSFQNSFHGRTLATLTATGQEKYHQGLGPLPAGFSYARLNDLDSVKALLDEETAAVLIEPIQGEGGVYLSAPGFLRDLKRLCEERGALLICDEVWSGVGRTGRWFAYQHYGIEPDIMALAKGLGGGLPIGAIVARREVAAAMKPGTHASTFGGNPLATRAGVAVLETIEEERLLENAQAQGKRLTAGLERLRATTSRIAEVRGLGLMLGVELTEPGEKIVAACREAGLLINCAHERVLRLAPALTITSAQVDEGLAILGEVLCRKAAPAAPAPPPAKPAPCAKPAGKKSSRRK